MAHDKIKRFIDAYIPVTTCNFRCKYCYITLSGAFANELPKFEYSPEYIARSLSQKRLGGVCVFNLCGGGETLLPPEMPAIIKALLAEGHYIMVVTNGVLTQRFQELEDLPKEYRQRLMIKFSFHYLELKEKNLFDVYFNNINRMKNAGVSYSVELTPHDELIPLIDEIQELCITRLGALCHVTVARDSRSGLLPILTNHSKEEYQKIWGSFESKLFEYKMSTFNVKREEFCYAGDWTLTMNLGTGDLFQCYEGKKIQNIYEDIDIPISFCATGNNCRESHCYNAHAFLTFGTIPELKTPYYLEMRDRKTLLGEHWIGEKMKEIFSSRCSETNKEYSPIKKAIVNFRNNHDLVGSNSSITQSIKQKIKNKLSRKEIK